MTEEPRRAPIKWTKAYDRAGIEAFLASVDAERGRLSTEIATAQRRLDDVRAAATAERTAAHAELGALVLAAQRDVAELERQHDEVIASIRAAAEAEASRIIAAARAEAASIRAAVASITTAFSDEPDVTTTDALDVDAHADAG